MLRIKDKIKVYTGGEEMKADGEVICGELEGAGNHFSSSVVCSCEGLPSQCVQISPHVKRSQNSELSSELFTFLKSMIF